MKRFYFYPFLYRNARISCNQHPTPLFIPWLEMDHMTDVSEDMLMDALLKAEQEVLQRRKMEYEVWNKCKLISTFYNKNET